MKSDGQLLLIFFHGMNIFKTKQFPVFCILILRKSVHQEFLLNGYRVSANLLKTGYRPCFTVCSPHCILLLSLRMIFYKNIVQIMTLYAIFPIKSIDMALSGTFAVLFYCAFSLKPL